jgi:hypothetical protein
MMQTVSMQAQTLEVGTLVGFTGYYGDLNNEAFISASQLRTGGLIFAKLKLSDRVSIGVSGGFMKVVGIDSLSSSAWQKGRNLSFYSDILEGTFHMDYYLIPNNGRNSLVPYVSAGLGFIQFTPYSILNGITYNLAAVKATGVAYSQQTFMMPISLGIKKYITDKFMLGLEVGLRITNTNFLDDLNGKQNRYLSPASFTTETAYLLHNRADGNNTPGELRGKTNTNDVYYIIGASVSYNLEKSNRKSVSFKKKNKCPRFY